jgi:hypothetical protein
MPFIFERQFSLNANLCSAEWYYHGAIGICCQTGSSVFSRKGRSADKHRALIQNHEVGK